jgi:hypothetical protein
MPAEKVSFDPEGFFDWYVVINLLLRSTFNTVVTKLQWVEFALEHFDGICTFIH